MLLPQLNLRAGRRLAIENNYQIHFRAGLAVDQSRTD